MFIEIVNAEAKIPIGSKDQGRSLWDCSDACV